MTRTIKKELARLERMSPAELREKHLDLFGEPSRSGNRAYLIKRIAWRLQAQAEGGLSERARQRAMEIARDADLRTTAPRDAGETTADVGPRKRGRLDGGGHHRDPRLPIPGTVITRTYRGEQYRVTVLDAGFELEGDHFKSLSAAARAVSGTHVNGFAFFNLDRKGARR